MANYEYIENTGVIIPDTQDLLDSVNAEFQVALGAELNLAPATPQGRLIATEVTARDTFIRNNAALANQINPNEAGGVFLDAILALTGGQRVPKARTLVSAVTMAGVPGTVIPIGTQARTDTGDIFGTLSTITLDGSGNGVVDFRAIEYGAIACPIAALSFPVSGVLGWESVTNATAGVIGRDAASDTATRQFRRVTLALQGSMLSEAIISVLNATEGVNSLSFRENTADTTQTIDTVVMISHSIYVCVDGGSDLDVATAILSKKSGGCGYNGATTVNVTDPNSGQIYPVTFDRPTQVAIQARATVRAGNALADPATTVRQAMVDYANGEIDGEQGFVVGASVSPFELAGAVNAEAPGIYVQKMEISIVGGVLGVAEIPITVKQLATLNINNITVVLL